MTVLRDDLVVAALKLLQADGGAGQTPAPEDMATVDEILDGLLEALNERQIYFAQDNQQFEGWASRPLARLLANEAAPEFGQAMNDASRQAAEATLREMRQSTYVPGTTLAVDYF